MRLALTPRAALMAALIGAALVWLAALVLTEPPRGAAWHPTVIVLGAFVGVADLALFSLIARIRGR